MKNGLTRMSFKAKVLITGMLILLIGVVGVAKFTQPSTISANEEQTIQSVTNADSQSDVVQALNEQVLNENQRVSARAATSSTEGYIPATAEEIAQRNAAYYAARGNFNPDAKVAQVSSWAEFRAAYEDEEVTKIKLIGDVIQSGTLAWTYQRKSSLEIDGSYVENGVSKRYQLSLYDVMLRTSNAPTGYQEDVNGTLVSRSIFHMHDVSISQNGTRSEGVGRYGFIGNTDYHADISTTNSPAKTAYTRNWYFRFGNIDTDNDENTISYRGMGRFLIGYQAEVVMYGENRISGTAENFYLGSLIFEDGTSYKGTTEYSDYSGIWFVTQPSATDTGASQELTVGKNSFIYLTNVRDAATGYPCVYGWYKDAVIGEGTTFNSNMGGSAWRFDFSGSLTIEKDATMNLISRGTGSVIQYGYGPLAPPSAYRAITATINVKPQGSLYVYGSTSASNASVYFDGGGTITNSSLILDNPKGFDIRNTGTTSSTNNTGRRAIYLGASANNNQFQIIDSDIDIWDIARETLVDGPSTDSFLKVDNFNVNSNGTVTTTEPGLQTFSQANYRRIAGMNSTPVTTWEPITDADKTYKARVQIGETPTGYDTNGNTILTPVYASSKSNVVVTVTDTHGTMTEHSPDDNGYITLTSDVFQIANLQMQAQALRGDISKGWLEDPISTTTVIDVTPPEPAKVAGNKVTNANKQLIGTGSEANAKITVQINGGALIDGGTVAADGSWSYNLPAYLTTGDKVKIFLEDNAGAAPADLDPIPPATNSVDGNINPATTALSYRDAIFQPATEYTVVDVLPNNPAITKTATAYRKGTEVSTTQVGDTLLYTITAKNDKASTFDTIWSDVVITDTLPAGLNFDSATAEVTVGGTVIDETQYNYNPTTRLLSVNVGNLATQESAVVTFKTTVARTAVGQVITNTAKAEGNSPREVEPFEPGPEIEGKAHEKYDKTSLGANNPGGAVYGTLELLSAPSAIDFGSVSYTGENIRVNNPTKIGDDLVVQDSRAARESWTLKATLVTPMTQVGGSGYVLDGALKYVYQGTEITLNGGAQDVVVHTNSSDEYNVSSTWSESGDGIKFEVGANQVKAVGDYQGEILWQLGDTP